MKRIISIILSVAMLMTLLCITASADDITSIYVTFDPHVDEDIHNNVTATPNQGDSLTCQVMYKLTGDGIAAFNNALNTSSINSTDDIAAICSAYPFPDDMSKYIEQEYLFVFSAWFGENTPERITISNNFRGDYLFNDGVFDYFYIIFTPKAAESSNDTNQSGGNNNGEASGTNGANGTNGTTTGTSATLDSQSSHDIDVHATYAAADEAAEIYSVVIKWGSMEFTYNSEYVNSWNPGTHEYEEREDAYWTYEKDANLITVINHSNVEIKANFAFQEMEDFDDVDGNFSTNDTEETVFAGAQTIQSAVDTTYISAPFFDAYLMLSGDLPEDTNGSVKCGVVTVTIS